MKLNYKIVSHNLKERNIVVRYYTDLLSEKELSVLPNESNNNPVRCRTDLSLSIAIPEPSEIQLHKFIIRNAPRQALKNLEITKMGPEKSGIDLSLKNTEAMIGKVFSKTEEEIELMLSNPVANLTTQQTISLLKEINVKTSNTANT